MKDKEMRKHRNNIRKNDNERKKGYMEEIKKKE